MRLAFLFVTQKENEDQNKGKLILRHFIRNVTAELTGAKPKREKVCLLVWQLIRKFHIRLGFGDQKTHQALLRWVNMKLKAKATQGILLAEFLVLVLLFLTSFCSFVRINQSKMCKARNRMRGYRQNTTVHTRSFALLAPMFLLPPIMNWRWAWCNGKVAQAVHFSHFTRLSSCFICPRICSLNRSLRLHFSLFHVFLVLNLFLGNTCLGSCNQDGYSR